VQNEALKGGNMSKKKFGREGSRGGKEGWQNEIINRELRRGGRKNIKSKKRRGEGQKKRHNRAGHGNYRLASRERRGKLKEETR